MTHDNSHKPAAARALRFWMRFDLEVADQSPSGPGCCTLKDPVSNRYWQLEAEEAFVLRALDGNKSAVEVCAHFGRRFAPRRLSEQQLTALLARFHAEGLIVSDQPGQSDAIFERLKRWRQFAPLRIASQLWAWRFRGVDADHWLSRLAPKFSWLFTIAGAAIFIFLLVSALLLVVSGWQAFEHDFTEIRDAFTAGQFMVVIATICAAKVLHELGHAIACKHFGGECHEIGLLLLFGMPSLYCNVSDAWMLRQKSSRILISSAGILVELSLASLSVWLWWFTYPGFVHTLAVYMVVVCSIHTLLINGNPLLQYDGYYVLADWTGTPNLRGRSREAVHGLLARWILGLRLPSKLTADRGQRWLAIYGIASTIYRVAVVAGLVWWLYGYLAPYDAQFVAWTAGAIMLLTLIVEPAMDLVRFLRRPGWDRDLPWRWVAPRAVLFSAACGALLLAPLPANVVAPAILEPRGARPVYATVEGKLIWAIAAGTKVEKGDVVARLENLALEGEIVRLSGERNARRQRLTNLVRRQADANIAAQIPTAQKSLADTEERLAQRRRDLEQLQIRAATRGMVLPPPYKRDPQTPPRWTGTPLDPENLGCYLKTGDQICVVGDPETMDAFVFVEQGSEDLIKRGQTVELLADSFPQRRLAGAISIAPRTRSSEPPEELLSRGELTIRRDAQGKPQANQVLFEARVELADQPQPLLTGGTGRVKVVVDPQSIAHRLWRALGQTFRGL